MKINTIGFAAFIGLVATVILTVLAYKKVVPENKRADLKKFGRFLHDLFNFKFLIIEKFLQFAYIFTTIGCVCFGLSMIFGFTYIEWNSEISCRWYGGFGLLIALVGPIILRLGYEAAMLFLLLLKNVMQINKKLKNQVDVEE